LPGCFVIVHDAEGDLLLKRHVEHGTYTAESPLEIAMPADGRAGDYRIVIVGFQNDTLLLHLPLTDLSLEVYGHTFYAARTRAHLLFRVPEGVEQLHFYARNGCVRIHQGDRAILDVAKDGTKKGSVIIASLAVEPGVDYRVEPYGTFYFGV